VEGLLVGRFVGRREGTPEGASNEQYNAFVRMRDIFAQSKPLEEAIESAMKATGYNPNK
jgi:hypothetical protein